MLPSLEAALQTSITAMIPLTGLPQEDIASELGHTEDQAVLPEAASFAVSSQVLERRPDVRIAERQLAAAFDRVGIRKLEPIGETFDPNFHQVMFDVENTGRPAGTVVQVLQAGYTIHGRLLREAMVGVAKRGAEDAGQPHIDTKA